MPRLGAPGTITTVQNPTLDDTLCVMREKANEAKKTLRPLAARICQHVETGDYNSEIGAIYAWVCMNIRYARDIHDVEYVQAPARLLESCQGDCDDIACLCAALCMAMGNECRFMVVGFEDKNPAHVFCQVAVRSVAGMGGNAHGVKDWVTLDPVTQELTAEMHSRIGSAQAFRF